MGVNRNEKIGRIRHIKRGYVNIRRKNNNWEIIWAGKYFGFPYYGEVQLRTVFSIGFTRARDHITLFKGAVTIIMSIKKQHMTLGVSLKMEIFINSQLGFCIIYYFFNCELIMNVRGRGHLIQFLLVNQKCAPHALLTQSCAK